MSRRDHRRIGNRYDVAGQRLTMRVEKRGEIRAADFLLALDEQDEIYRQVAFFLEHVLDAKDVGENLSLVVTRPARRDDAVFDARIKRGPVPQAEGIDRLHIIVPINQDSRASLPSGTTCDNDGMSRRFIFRHRQADGRQFVLQPFGAAQDLILVFRIGRDAAKAKKIEELG